MPRTLESSLAGIPIYRALLAQRQFDQNQQSGALSNALRQQQILAGQRSQQEEEELKGVVSQAGGDPERAIKALLASGKPKAIELATKLRGLVPKPGLQPIGAGGAYTPATGGMIPPMMRPGDPNKIQPIGAGGAIGPGGKLIAPMARPGDPRQSEARVRMLGTALERANLPEADAVLRSVEDVLNKTPELSEYLAGPKSLLPDLMVPENVRAGRQAFKKLFNITLKNRSGAAVTNPEFERLKQEFATGVWKTPAQINEGVRQARNIISTHYRSVAAGFGTDALNAYNENLRELGGTPLLELQTERRAAPRKPAKRIVVDY